MSETPTADEARDALALARLRAAADEAYPLPLLDSTDRKRFLLFENDDVLVDFDEIVRADALTEAQIKSFQDYGKPAYRSVVFLRHGGSVYLTTPFVEVTETIRQVVEVAS